MALSFFDLGFCNISQTSLDLTSFFSCCFICCCAFASASLPFFNRYWKENPNAFFGSIWSSLNSLKKGEWQHFQSSLPTPHADFQAHLEPSPSTTNVCKPSITTTTTNPDSRKLIPANLFVNNHSRKSVPLSCFSIYVFSS